MANDKKKKEVKTYVTPKGTILFAAIKEIDYGTEDYPCKEGRFKLTLALSKKEAKVLIGKLEEDIENAKENALDEFENLKPQTKKKLGKMRFNEVFQEEYDKDENPTGNLRFNFRTNAFFKTKDGTEKRKTIPIFDSLNQPVKLPDEIANGSVGRIAFSTSPYFVEGTGVGGLSLFLNAIQLIDYQRPGERSAEAYGFEVDEDADGFITSQVNDEDTSSSSDTDNKDDDDNDGDF